MAVFKVIICGTDEQKMNTQNDPSKQTVVISGATGGLGKAMAVECASRGWNLYLTDYSAQRLEVFARSLRNSYPITVETCACDLTEAGARSQLLEQFGSRGQIFTMIINVAGVDYEGTFLEQTSAQSLQIIQTNLEATLVLIREILPLRQPGKRFHVVNVSSLSAFFPMPTKAVYAASKRFLLDFSLALQEELNDENVGVTVLCPAGMPTNQECLYAIEAQGWMGEITTVDVGRVAYQTINAAMKGKEIVIPGWINRFILTLSKAMPVKQVIKVIYKRWRAVRSSREVQGTLMPSDVDPFLAR